MTEIQFDLSYHKEQRSKNDFETNGPLRALQMSALSSVKLLVVLGPGYLLLLLWTKKSLIRVGSPKDKIRNVQSESTELVV